MFKKPKRNFRSRKADDSDSDEENKSDVKNDESSNDSTNGGEKSVEIPGLNLLKEKKKKRKKEKSESSSKGTVLSFDHEELNSEEAFKIKRSSHSRRVAKQLKKLSQLEKEEQDKEEATPSPPSNYSEEKLRELKEEQDLANGAISMEVDEEGEEDEKESFRELLQRGVIPDAAMIHMARKKRQLAREAGDFIPVDDTVRCEGSKSRLVREDDNDHSDEEEESRMSMTVPSKDEELRQIQNTFLAVEHGSNSEGSDQEREWEEQQIRKGVKSGAMQPEAATESNDYYSNIQHFVYSQPSIFNPNMPSYDGRGGQEVPQHSLGTRAPGQIPTNLPEVTMQLVRKRLQDRFDTLSDTHRNHVHERDDLSSRMELSENAIVEAENSKGSLEEQYRFFQETRGYVRDLVECLNEKYPSITGLEFRMLNLLRQRTARLIRRRQDDLKDQSEDLSTGSIHVRGKTTVPVGAMNEAKQRRIAEREARRSRRRRKREVKEIMGHNEGLSTDDEENQSEITKFNMERDRIHDECSRLFEDVVEDFYDLDHVKLMFENWKHRYRDTYQEAYIGLCLPKLFTPVVRLKLVDWIPFEEDCPRIEEMPWYESLMFFCHRIDPDIELDDPDIKLLPSIIEKVVLPKIKDLVETVWDPMSSQQTHRLVKLIRKLVETYPTISASSKNTQAMFKSVVVRLQRTLDDDVFMPLVPRQLLENAASGSSVFFHRQCWGCIKLLRNILSWFGLLSDSTVKELALDSLLNRYILLALQNAPVTQETIQKCQTIVSTFPKVWFSELSEQTLPQLTMFARCLVSLADQLDTSNKDLSRKETRDSLKQIAKMLMSIGAMEQAVAVGSKFNLKL